MKMGQTVRGTSTRLCVLRDRSAAGPALSAPPLSSAHLLDSLLNLRLEGCRNKTCGGATDFSVEERLKTVPSEVCELFREARTSFWKDTLLLSFSNRIFQKTS